MSLYPRRPGEPDCRDYLRTGRCKYGESCKYHHPTGGMQTTDPNEPPFPIRPDEPVCQYYLKNGSCKFGQACKFHHPPHMMGKARPSYAGGIAGDPNLNIGPNLNLPYDISIPGEGNIGLVSPQRPNEPDCIYYLKHGTCKYGATCKYHHPINAHTIGAHPARYGSQPVYCDRSASGGSLVETRDIPGSARREFPMNPQLYQTIDQGRRVVDSVPQKVRHGSLDTIYHSYKYQGQQTNGKWLRYYKHSTPDGSPNPGSPSITSSTIASSYETAFSNIEKLPQFTAQNQSATIQRTLSSNSHHSSEDAMLTFGDAMMPPTTHEGSRISGVRHYGSQAAHANHTISRQKREESHDVNGIFPNPERRIAVDNYNEQLMLSLQRQQDDDATPRAELRGKQLPVRNVVDDGLSMMTSALLTMLDTPGDTNGDSGTISTHSSNYDDAIVPMNDNPYMPRSLNEYPVSTRPPELQTRNGLSQSMSRTIGLPHNGYHATNYNHSHTNGFHHHLQHEPPNHYPRSSEHVPNMRDEIHSSHRHNGIGHVNVGANVHMNFSEHDGHKVSAILPGWDNPEAVADIQRGQWNPNSDTVGSVPTQFFLAP